jgi:putative transposase
MKRKRYSEEQIISILKEHQAGASVPDLARRHSVVENTIYRWKSKYGGMEISEAKRLRDLEQENARLKRLLAEAELDKAALKEFGMKVPAEIYVSEHTWRHDQSRTYWVTTGLRMPHFSSAFPTCGPCVLQRSGI